MAILAWMVGNKYTWIIGAAIIVVLLYFGWRHKQRGIGAAKIIEELQRARAKHETSTADKIRKADESLADPATRDGVRKRHSRD